MRNNQTMQQNGHCIKQFDSLHFIKKALTMEHYIVLHPPLPLQDPDHP